MGFLHNDVADNTGRKPDKPGDLEKSIKARKLSVAQEELIDHIKKKKIGNVLVKNKTDTEAKNTLEYNLPHVFIILLLFKRLFTPLFSVSH